MTRNLLEKRMQLLTSELAEMGSLVEKQLYNSIEAFKNKDMVLAKKVIENDEKRNQRHKRLRQVNGNGMDIQCQKSQTPGRDLFPVRFEHLSG